MNSTDSQPNATPVTSFGQRLADAVLRKKNAVCVGLDPRSLSLPETIRPKISASLASQASAFETFCLQIIDAVSDLVPVVKPQAAFFEELGPEGMRVLARIIRHATQQGLLVVLDGKRGDIGTTAAAYANAFLGSGPEGTRTYSAWGADALTVNPFLGMDTLESFIQRCDNSETGLFVLVKTSNPGSGFIQDTPVIDRGNTSPGNSPPSNISEAIADQIQTLAHGRTGPDGYSSIGAVVGATYPAQLLAMRERMPNTWLLIPGYGAQGGAAADVVRGMDGRGLGAIVNSSRGIIFAHESPKYKSLPWIDAVRNATLDMIEALRAAHS